MELGNGNDIATVFSQLLMPVIIDGGAGNDLLTAGSGNAILLGGAGDDQLFAGSGRNILIGGDGRDLLATAASGGSILIGGRTAHDANDQALRDILAEWSSSRSLQQRIANLTDGSGTPSRLNRGAFLNSSTLVDDGVVDVVFGDSRRDWFLRFSRDLVIDSSPSRRIAFRPPIR
jgi:Ca2+-binding RTX toxin-like protein